MKVGASLASQPEKKGVKIVYNARTDVGDLQTGKVEKRSFELSDGTVVEGELLAGFGLHPLPLPPLTLAILTHSRLHLPRSRLESSLRYRRRPRPRSRRRDRLHQGHFYPSVPFAFVQPSRRGRGCQRCVGKFRSLAINLLNLIAETSPPPRNSSSALSRS